MPKINLSKIREIFGSDVEIEDDTSQPPETFTREQVDKMIADAKAAAEKTDTPETFTKEQADQLVKDALAENQPADQTQTVDQTKPVGKNLPPTGKPTGTEGGGVDLKSKIEKGDVSLKEMQDAIKDGRVDALYREMNQGYMREQITNAGGSPVVTVSNGGTE